jgi:ankyrin repeat protein
MQRMRRMRARVLGLVLAASTVSSALAGVEQDFALAASTDDVTTVRKLLAKGTDPNTVDPVSHETVLLLALREGAQRVIDELVNARDLRLEQAAPNGNTPLMMAAFKRNGGAVQALLARGAAVNRPGWAPLHYAAAGGDPAITRLLIARGADVNARAVAGFTPLMMAAREGQEEAVEVLLRAGADARLTNSEGLNAAQMAEQADKPRIVAAIAHYLKNQLKK